MPATVHPVAFSKKAVRRLLNQQFGKMGDVLLDDQYFVLSQPEWDQVIKAIGPEKDGYRPNRFDCDSFSRVFWGKVNEQYEVNGLFVVIDYSGKHSYNALLIHDGKQGLTIRLYEPQNGTYPTKGAKPYICGSGFFI